MKNSLSSLINIMEKLFIHPQELMIQDELIDIDQGFLLIFFLIVSIIIGLLFSLFVSPHLILLPLLILVGIRVFEFYFYFMLKILGKNYKKDEKTKILFGLIVFLYFIFSLIINNLVYFETIKLFINTVIMIWYIAMLLLLLKIRLNQNWTRSI